MKILLVDDESLARARLRKMLESLNQYDIIGEAENGNEAISLCERYQPDVIFMDIKMPERDGLSAAKVINERGMVPYVVFCTAYDEYALDAFEVEARGYLLKPVKLEKLTTLLEKLRRNIRPAEITSDGLYLSAKTHRGIERVALDQCRYFLADSKYVTVYHASGVLIIDETLKQLEERFSTFLLRIHRNALVSKKHVIALEKQTDRFAVKLSDCDSMPLVSRRLLPDVKAALGLE